MQIRFLKDLMQSTHIFLAESSLITAGIVGGIVGGLVVIILVIVIIITVIVLRKRRMAKSNEQNSSKY